jgi:hypothetical protein
VSNCDVSLNCKLASYFLYIGIQVRGVKVGFIKNIVRIGSDFRGRYG